MPKNFRWYSFGSGKERVEVGGYDVIYYIYESGVPSALYPASVVIGVSSVLIGIRCLFERFC